MIPKYADWQPCLWDYFEVEMKRLSIVELGKGEGTMFLHKHFKSVVSVEYSRWEYTATWEKEGLPGHKMVVVEMPKAYIVNDDIVIKTKGRTRPRALAVEANRLYNEAKRHKADVLFIDHGAHNRGEVLELAKRGKWKYIIVHDINPPYHNYRLESKRHKTTYYRAGQGTAILKLIE